MSQIGTDRIIDVQFSDGQYRLFLEFYAGGNIILTDKDLKILALLRIVPLGEEQEELRVGLRYSIENRQNYSGIPELTTERVRKGLEAAAARDAANSAAGKKQRKKGGSALRKGLATSVTEFPPMLLDHALKVQDFDAATPIEDALKDDGKLEKLMGVLKVAQTVINEITAAPVAKGYIIAKPMKKGSSEDRDGNEDQEIDKENESLLYDDFHPFRPFQVKDDPDVRVLAYDGFNATVDEFYSSLESQKLESRLTEKEENAKRKLQAAKDDHARRLGGLQQVQELNVRKAQAIECNTQRVEEACGAINGLIAQGMDWVEIDRLIEMEKARGNPVAEMIKSPLKLHENTATLLLGEEVFEDPGYESLNEDETDSEVSDSEDEGPESTVKKGSTRPEDKRLAVDVDLGLTPWSNARQYYDQKKTAAVKEQKTIQSSATALKSTEQKINADLKKGLTQEKQQLRPVRKQLWFEKFYYFISSEGYLVVGGRDSQQNDILYRRYLNKGDCWVNAELTGAACLIVKNRPGLSNSPIPISTLSQAGTFCVATSSAWDNKAVMAAWWVECEQVSKTAPAGDFLGQGMFHIHGQKSFLPPAQLLLGFGVMFRVSDESMKKHTKHRLFDDRVANDPPSTTADADTEAPPESDADEVASHNETEHNDGQAVDGTEEEKDDGDESDEALDREDGDDGYDHPQYSNPLQSSTQASNTQKMEDLSLDDKDPAGDDESSSDESEAGGADEDSAPVTGTATPSEGPSQPGQPPFKAKQAPVVRGKRGKKSKIKSKYANQDDEDRALAMQLLGSAAGQEKAKAEAEAKVKKEAESIAQKERRRQQHQAAQASGKEAEEERKLKLSKDIPTMESEELDELALVENFVGTPLPGDEILDCLVICGPWDAMGAKLMWRVKVQPGAQKKGKAVKEILASWNRLIGDREKRKMPGKDAPGYEAEITMRKQAELVKNLRDAEVIGVVPVGKIRAEMKGAGGSGGKGGGKAGGKGGGKGGKKGGKGSKKK